MEDSWWAREVYSRDLVVRMSGNLQCGSRSDRLDRAGVGEKDTEALVGGEAKGVGERPV